MSIPLTSKSRNPYHPLRHRKVQLLQLSMGRRILGKEASRRPVTKPQRDLVEAAESKGSKLKWKRPSRHKVRGSQAIRSLHSTRTPDRGPAGFSYIHTKLFGAAGCLGGLLLFKTVSAWSARTLHEAILHHFFGRCHMSKRSQILPKLLLLRWRRPA